MAYYRAVSRTTADAGRIGVLLVNLGTPDSATYRGVQRYLREFLSDRRVINTSRLIWLPLLYGVILPLRPFRTVKTYRKIWLPEGSPLAVYSARLTARVGAALQENYGDRIRVALGMTYGNPSIAHALDELSDQQVSRILVLPLYPQYCSSTTGSVFDRTATALQRHRWLPEMRFVNEYYADGAYIAAMADRIDAHWRAAGARSHLVLSYHGIPAKYVAEGDPYKDQAEATTRLITKRLGLGKDDYSHCYQSRFGRVEWLKPYAIDTLTALAQRGVKRLTVASPAFAVDCLETVEEIGIEYRELFEGLGGEELSLVPALNDTEPHALALAGIVTRHLQDWN